MTAAEFVAWRKALGPSKMTQTDVAQLLGVSVRTVARYESGDPKHKVPQSKQNLMDRITEMGGNDERQ